MFIALVIRPSRRLRKKYRPSWKPSRRAVVTGRVSGAINTGLCWERHTADSCSEDSVETKNSQRLGCLRVPHANMSL